MANQRRPSSQIAPVDSASPANGIELRSFFLGREIASRHLEAGQKLDIAPLASSAAFADAKSLLGCAKLRPAFFQLVFGICFVFRAGPKPVAGASIGTCRFFVAVSGNIEGRQSVGGPGRPDQSHMKPGRWQLEQNEGTHSGPPSNVSKASAVENFASTPSLHLAMAQKWP